MAAQAMAALRSAEEQEGSDIWRVSEESLKNLRRQIENSGEIIPADVRACIYPEDLSEEADLIAIDMTGEVQNNNFAELLENPEGCRILAGALVRSMDRLHSESEGLIRRMFVREIRGTWDRPSDGLETWDGTFIS